MGAVCMKVNDPKGLKISDHGISAVASKLAKQCKPAYKNNQVMSVKQAFLAQKDIKINQRVAALERTFQKPACLVSRIDCDSKISSLRESCSAIQEISESKHSDSDELDDSWLNRCSDGKPDIINLAGGKNILKSKEISPISRDRWHKHHHSDSASTKDRESSTSLRDMLLTKLTLQELPASEGSTPPTKKIGSRDCKSMNELVGHRTPTCAEKVLQAKKNLLLLAVEPQRCLPSSHVGTESHIPVRGEVNQEGQVKA